MNNGIAEGVIRFTVAVRVLCDVRHDNGDRRTNEVWSTGRNLSYGYDRAHQLTDVTSPARASDRASYRYDKAGNPIRRTEMGLGVTNSFNNLNRIVSGIWTGGAITVAGAVNYPAGTVTVAGVTGTIYPDRTFDVANVTVTAGTNVLTAVYHGPAFTNTQMVATDKVTVVVGNAAYTHDANGSLTCDQNFAYQYDLANRLTNVISKASGSSVLAARYDGLGRRIEVTRNASTVERYVYFPGSFLVLAVLDGSNQLKEIYTHGPDLSGTVGGAGGIGGILSCRIGSSNVWFHADAMGNIILATDQQGKEIGHYRYSPFGRPLNQTGTFRPRFLYSSKEYDPESSLLNFGYRHLNPQLGRWMERDRIYEKGGINLYNFVANSPSRFIDAYGLAPSLDWQLFTYWLHGTGGESVRLSWGDFNPDGSDQRFLASSWKDRNRAKLKALCSKAACGQSEVSGEATTPIREEELYSEAHPWISFWAGKAWLYEQGGIGIHKDCKACRCDFEFNLKFEATDRSDFNPGQRFGPGDFFREDWFIWLRDHTIIGHDYNIYATDTTLEQMSIPLTK